MTLSRDDRKALDRALDGAARNTQERRDALAEVQAGVVAIQELAQQAWRIRDAVIRFSAASGMTRREIGDAVGLSRQAVDRVLTKETR